MCLRFDFEFCGKPRNYHSYNIYRGINISLSANALVNNDVVPAILVHHSLQHRFPALSSVADRQTRRDHLSGSSSTSVGMAGAMRTCVGTV